MRWLHAWLCRHGFHAWELYIRWNAHSIVERCRYCGKTKELHRA